MSIEIEESYASDDSCQVKFWCRGHYSWGEFQNAVWDHIERQERDIPYWVVVQAPVQQLYQRAVPDRESIVSETRYVHSETKGRGAYPITLMDFWFPLHAYKPRQPNAELRRAADEL